MRIRKNAKLSPLLFSSSLSSSSSSSCVQGGSVPLESHVCQLNQSPWDVIPFDSDSIQFKLDDNFTAGNNNGSAVNSFAAVQSVASMMDAGNKTTCHSTVMVDLVAPTNIDATVNMTNPCQFHDDKGWPCKNEAGQGQSFCEQHLSYSLLTPLHHTSSKKSQPSATGTRRGKTRGAAGKKAAAVAAAGASSNPYEFYYYSGFGPSWSKRRGDRNGGGEGSKNNSVGVENSTMVESENVVGGGADDVVDDINGNVASVEVVPSVSEMEHDGIIDYVDDDEEEEEEEVLDDSGKKRMRKPVKARSLKSLM
ncbi:hypothetical protein GLYMA_16G034200v4 [Glycine max]|uniref:WRC domain-containing protein n=1 Tax=Glycine max TaxID=3847 RepID=K7MF08_SOYBN|nr:uncharacterized protein LOC102667126 [Glycine max]KRH06611.1 hypothetical protein GLYMA_16G034200v4 [Glycine max]|eukprot:XP_006598952.1 uncharacterized protein LOC102667126 [Glycine max]